MVVSKAQESPVNFDHLEHAADTGHLSIEEDFVQLGHLSNQEDRSMSKWQAARFEPWALTWCLFAAWTILLITFENQASGNILGFPEFRKDFGVYYNGEWVLEAKWQLAIMGGPLATSVIGAFISASLADYIGRKYLIIAGLVLTYVAITMEFVATANDLFFCGKLLNGFATAALQVSCITYIGEVSPLALRGILTSLIGFVFTLGPFIVALIVNATGDMMNRWAYRSVFCSQYGFAAISTVFIWFMPESPWWLMSKGENKQAERSLQRLGYSGPRGAKKLAAIALTLEEIRQESEGSSYLECFRRSNRRRTLVSVAPICLVSLSGIVFASSYSTYYMQLAGYSTSMSFKLQITQQVLSMLGNVMSWYSVDRIGRRNLSIYGLAILTVILWIMAGLGTQISPGSIKGTCAMILIYCWWFNATIGATSWVILAEVATPRLRGKTVALGNALSNILNLIWFLVLPYLFNPDKANLGAKVAFIFGGFSILGVVYLWFFQPETAGRSYEELDEMFMKHISAKDFHSYKTDSEARGEVAKTKESELHMPS